MLQILMQLLAVNATIDLAQFVDRIGRANHLQCISIIHSAGTDIEGFIDALHRGNNYFNQLPKIISGDGSTSQLDTLTDTQTLFVVLARSFRDPVVKLHEIRARDRRECKTLFVLQRKEPRNALKSFFEYLWVQGFRSALVMIAQQQLYYMDPYPSQRVIELNPYQHASTLFPKSNRRDFMGYKLRVPVQVDVPSTFWYTVEGKVQIDGAGGTLMRELMEHLNVSMELYPLYINGSNNMHMSALVQLVADKRAEISPHQFTTLQRSSRVDYSYPYSVVQRCFMLPTRDPYPHGLYFILPLKICAWLSLILVGSIVILVHYMFRRLTPQFPAMPTWAILEVPGSHSFTYEERRATYHFPRFPCALLICTCFIFSAFVIVQLYASKLTSLLTVTLTRKPAVTLQEMFDLPYSILVLPTDVDTIVSSFGHEQQFRQQFSITNEQDFYKLRMEMSPDHIYPISMERWGFITQQQRYLHYKRFWLSQLCYGTFPYQFQLSIGSHFKHPLHHFELHVHEAGLHTKWSRMWYKRAKMLGFVSDFASVESYEQMHKVNPLDVHCLACVFYLLLIGQIVSLGAFIMEIVLF